MPSRLLVHAPNVHSGGGAALLLAVLSAWPEGGGGVVQVDQRMPIADLSAPKLHVRSVKPTVWQRLMAEFWLFKQATGADLVLCFGNLPPLFRLRSRVVVFLQNRYLVDDAVSLRGFPWRTRFRLEIERRWFAWRVVNAQTVVVQTPSMQRLLESSGTLHGQSILVMPFVNTLQGYQRGKNLLPAESCGSLFLYVASGEPHKNHRRLVEAWCLLACEGLFPTLWLTLDAVVHVDLCLWIERQKQQFNLNIKNLGAQAHSEVLCLYTKVDAMIFPSIFESFGIPLIEARQAQLPILAGELDYVRDVIDPEQVFDPMSPISMARAVKRFLGEEEGALPLLDARQFLVNIVKTFK